MADIIGQASGFLSTFGWASLGQIVFVIAIVFITAIVLILGLFFMWYKSFYIKVKIYEPYGQLKLSKQELEKIARESKTDSKALDKNHIKFDMIKFRKTKGKYTKIKGTPYFQTLMPLRKLEPIPIDYMFDDGVHLLRLGREVYIPIPKPLTVISVGKNVSIAVAEDNKWQAWNNIMADRINNKFQDLDVQKKVVMYFVIGIVALVLIGGFILWLVYSSVNKGYVAAETFNKVAQSLTGGGNAPV